MKRINKQTSTLLAGSLLLGIVTTQPAHAMGSAQHLSEAVVHSTQAVGHSVVGSAQLASGVVAVPLIAVGSVGQVSQQAGNDLWQIANEPIGTPLPISDETITAGPSPAQAIKE